MKSKIYIESLEARHLMATSGMEGIGECSADIEDNSIYVTDILELTSVSGYSIPLHRMMWIEIFA